jgi:hypothetical protein
MTDGATQSGGPATDALGGPVIDPTKNVLDLVDSETRRQDNLREAESRHVREIIHLRGQETTKEMEATQYVERLRAEHARELRRAEAARIDAIRAVDVGAVQQAAQVQATQATTLAAQVATSAETLRTQVAAAASAATIALAAALEPVQKDIADLRRVQYEAVGTKAQVVDTRESKASSGLVIGLVISGVAMVIGLLVLLVAVAVATHGFTK